MITNEYYRHVRMNNAPVNVCNGINNIERRSSEYILNDDRRVKIDEIGKKKKKTGHKSHGSAYSRVT